MSITRFQAEGLQLMGYKRRESEFLFLVATHSGYFTNRQFQSFAQTKSGAVSHAFVRKLLERKHASFHAYRSGGRVYHLFARKVYQAIERENLRTRKKHELEYVKTRLVALDFVLANPQHRYLETEAAKVAFFAKEYGVSPEMLPVKQYRARKSAEVTPRYFVDRFPMFVNPLSSTPLVTFSYVDPGAVTVNGLGTHLRGYLKLFEALPAFEFVYIAPTMRLSQAAESEFQHILFGGSRQSKTVSLLEYFRLRKAWDAKERVASAEVILLKEAQARYVGTRIEELYRKWLDKGIPDDELMRAQGERNEAQKVMFRTEICGSSLTVFSAPTSKDLEDSLEKDEAEEIPGQSSVQVSGL